MFHFKNTPHKTSGTPVKTGIYLSLWIPALAGMLILILMAFSPAIAGTPIPFTINLSENVVVTGTPRIQLDIGGVTRYATYTGGSGTSALTFSYPIVAPDFDRNGISIISPIDLNGGTIKDLNGNDATLTFTPPNTSGVLVQSYQTAFTTSPIDSSNEAAASFNITGAPSGATYNYTITSSGGAGSVTGSGTISADPQPVTGVNVSGLPFGTLTASVTVTNATGTGNAKTGTVAGSWVAPLDALPSPASAFSVRRLLTSYTGPLMQIRRSSDNTIQDIGLTFSGNLNTAALTTFCGANSCYVSKWYDQSGNGRDSIQTTTANQPRIVNAGAQELLSTRAGIKFIKSSSTRLITSPAPLLSYPIQTSIIAKVDGSSSGAFIKLGGPNDGIGIGIGNPWFENVGLNLVTLKEQIVWMPTSVTITTGVPNVYSFMVPAGGAASTLHYNQTPVSILSGSTNSALSPTTALYIGGYIAAGSENRYTDATIGEVLLFGSTFSNTDRQTLEANQKAYYGTP